MKNLFRFMVLSALLMSMIACNPNNPVFPSTGGGNVPEGLEAVDLGLPSGLKWANMNVGATAPEEAGLYLAWGEMVGYGSDTNDGRSFDWENYKWMAEGQSRSQYVNKYTFADGQTSASWYQNGNFIGDNKTVLDPEDDAAHVNWGGSWHMPTDAEWNELRTECTWTWTTQNGVNGRLVTGPNGNSIFLPASGSRVGAILYGVGTIGIYWSSSLYTSSSDHAFGVFFYFDRVGRYCDYRFVGLSVRPVIR